MANKFQLKRTTVSGRTANTTDSGNTSFIDKGELAINLADRKVFSSDSSNTIFEVGSNLTNLAVTSSATFNNDAALKFKTLNGNTVSFVQQSDDNFVFYTTNTSGGQRAVFSIFANTNNSNLNFAIPATFSANISVTKFVANGSLGGAGEVLTSNGNGVYWQSLAAVTTNTAASYSWTNTHSFAANVSFANNISITSGNSSVAGGFLLFNGLADANWKIGRNTNGTTKWYYTNNTLDILAANSNLEGIVLGNPLVGGATYIETGHAGTYIAANVTVGNSSSKSTINSTAFSGTANNSTYFDGATWAAPKAIGTGTANSGAFTTVSATGNVTGDMIISSNNGNGTNFKVGDDAWIGDINTADTLRVSGQQSANNGYIVFGNADTTSKLGRAGTGALTYTGNFSVTGNVDVSTINATSFGATITANSTTAVFTIGNSSVSSTVNSTTFSGTANNASNLGGSSLATVQGQITGNAATAYTNAVSYTDSKIATANSAITGNAATAYTNATSFASNGSNISTGTVAFARLPTVDSVANTSVALIPTANNVKTAYDAAITANTNAATALTAAGSAYSNAVSYTDTKIGTANSAIVANASAAYTNAVSYTDGKILTANSAITGNAATAYSNATSYTDTKIGTANSAMIANASAAYTNATTYASNASNISTGTLAFARLPTVDSVANTSVSLVPTANNVKTAYDAAITANTNAQTALSAADNAFYSALQEIDGRMVIANLAITDNAATAYTNATTYASNASNLSTGTVAEARLPYRMNQNVRTSDTVEFAGITLTGNLVVSGNVNVVGANNLIVSDNMIYLNSNNDVTNPDIGIAGNYNDGVYHHAGFFRDATDGFWKVFDNYDPEPDANVYIDTSNTSFHIADFWANTARVGNTSVYATINTTSFSGTANNSTNFGGLSLATVQSQITGNAATAYTNATTYASNASNISTGTLAFARLPTVDSVANTSVALVPTANNVKTAYDAAITANTNAQTALSAADNALYTAIAEIDGRFVVANSAITGNAETAYTNATTFSANASNISSGTLAAARLPALYLGTTTIQSTSAAQAVSGITTLAAGNTTITGFANVTSTLQIGSNTFFDTTGNLGLGTSTPEPDRRIDAWISNPVANAWISIYNSSTSGQSKAGYRLDTPGGTWEMYTNRSTGALAFSKNGHDTISAYFAGGLGGGYVGFGASPTERLDVASNFNNPANIRNYNSNTGASAESGLKLETTTVSGFAKATQTDYRIGTSTSHKMVVVTGGVDNITVLPSGNTGIGTTTPGYRLQVNGNAYFNGGIEPRVVSLIDTTSITLNSDTTDIGIQINTQAAGTLTINAPTGTAINGKKIMLRIKSTNVQTFSWNAIFAGSTDTALPTATSGSSKTDYLGFQYDSTAAKWHMIAKNFGF